MPQSQILQQLQQQLQQQAVQLQQVKQQQQLPQVQQTPSSHPPSLPPSQLHGSGQNQVDPGTAGGHPRGDAFDSDYDDAGSLGGSEDSHRRRARGRGRGRARATRQEKQRRHSDSEDDDPNDGYALNRERPETYPKSLSVKEFSHENKSQDFDIWINQFEGAVNRGTNPHSQRRHYNYCLQWLPNYLGPDAYSIWRRSKHHSTNWIELKKELRQEYEDPIIRSEWKSNLSAYTWDESKESLHTYCSKVKRYVDTFDVELADAPQAKQGQYYIRFVSGLPEDYQKQIRMAMPTSKQNIDKAYDVSLRYQATKKGKAINKAEIGAAVSFEDPAMPARVTQNETDIVRLKNRMAKVEQHHSSSDRSTSGRPRPVRYLGNSPHRMQGRDTDFSSDSSQRSKDRLE